MAQNNNNVNKNVYPKEAQAPCKDDPTANKFKEQEKKDSIPKGYRKGKGNNDISWHKRFPELSEQAASIPWSWATGKPFRPDYAEWNTSQGQPSNDKFMLPGALAIRCVMTPGTGNKASDAVNVAAQALYTDIRRMLKSANAYDQSDVMIYVLAIAEIRAYISWLTRLYATLMLYSHETVYLPDALIRLQGVSPRSLHDHALEFLSRANQAIAKASQIYIPKGFAFLDRADWLYANYYSEGTSIKDQIYFFTPEMFRKFDLDPEGDYKGFLKPELWIPSGEDAAGVTPLQWEDLTDHLEAMIDALVGDTDFQNIAGDLMNRYGEGGVMTFGLIPQDAVISIIPGNQCVEVLEQIQNSRALAPVYLAQQDHANKFWEISQNVTKNIVEASKTITIDPATQGLGNTQACLISALEIPLTVHEAPSVDKTMLVTRLHNTILEVNDAADNKIEFVVDAACEIITRYQAVGSKIGSNVYDYDVLTFFNLIEQDYLARHLWYTNAFHYVPSICIWSGSDYQLLGYIWNADLIAKVSPTQLEDMNRVDMMSLFAVPNFAKVRG